MFLMFAFPLLPSPNTGPIQVHFLFSSWGSFKIFVSSFLFNLCLFLVLAFHLCCLTVTNSQHKTSPSPIFNLAMRISQFFPTKSLLLCYRLWKDNYKTRKLNILLLLTYSLSDGHFEVAGGLWWVDDLVPEIQHHPVGTHPILLAQGLVQVWKLLPLWGERKVGTPGWDA